mmetsp:Transcript_43819/g.103609  ORF Transcript_43819/g.103609 Transcript_43819/m.103609 type:complete len:223 (-) Transcript_43819:791-1459(-)
MSPATSASASSRHSSRTCARGILATSAKKPPAFSPRVLKLTGAANSRCDGWKVSGTCGSPTSCKMVSSGSKSCSLLLSTYSAESSAATAASATSSAIFAAASVLSPAASASSSSANCGMPANCRVCLIPAAAEDVSASWLPPRSAEGMCAADSDEPPRCSLSPSISNIFGDHPKAKPASTMMLPMQTATKRVPATAPSDKAAADPSELLSAVSWLGCFARRA